MRGDAGVKFILALVVLAILGALGFGVYKRIQIQKKQKQAQAAMAQRPPAEVGVMTVKSQKVAITAELPGRTVPCLVAEVRPQVNGIIQKRLFTEGTDVQEGQVLYEIDASTYQAALDNAVAALERSKASLPPIRLKRDRYRQLLADGAISEQEYDDAAAAYRQAEADIEFYEAGVKSARINLEHTKIKAPISGRIGRSAVTVGALASAFQGVPFATIQQLNPIYVDAPQSSAALLRFKRKIAEGAIKSTDPNQVQVRLLLEDGTPYGSEGSLKFSDVTIDQGTGSFILRMIFPNPAGTLMPGMFVRAVVEEGIVEQAILVPQKGVSRDPKGNPIALLVDAKGMVEQRALQVDRAIGDKWLVTGGLKPGDRLILEGLQMAKPGAPAKVVPLNNGSPGAGAPAGGPPTGGASPASASAAPSAATRPAQNR